MTNQRTHHHNPVLHAVAHFTWLVTALASLHIGLVALNVFDITTLAFYQAHIARFAYALAILVGACGLYSLIGYLRSLATGCRDCCC